MKFVEIWNDGRGWLADGCIHAYDYTVTIFLHYTSIVHLHAELIRHRDGMWVNGACICLY